MCPAQPERPRVIKVMSIVLVSNIVLGRLWGGMRSDTSMAMMLKKKAQDVPSTTRTSKSNKGDEHRTGVKYRAWSAMGRDEERHKHGHDAEEKSTGCAQHNQNVQE